MADEDPPIPEQIQMLFETLREAFVDGAACLVLSKTPDGEPAYVLGVGMVREDGEVFVMPVGELCWNAGERYLVPDGAHHAKLVPNPGPDPDKEHFN